MPEVRKQSFYIYEICDVANSDKTITKIKAKNNVGEYPVYAATINKPFAYINFYNNEKPCLVVINDGAAGCTYLAWIIHGVAVKVAESHIVTIF